MAYWLFKSEPGEWSWDDQASSSNPDGEEWDGNPQLPGPQQHEGNERRGSGFLLSLGW